MDDSDRFILPGVTKVLRGKIYITFHESFFSETGLKHLITFGLSKDQTFHPASSRNSERTFSGTRNHNSFRPVSLVVREPCREHYYVKRRFYRYFIRRQRDARRYSREHYVAL
jgi:hypothetical protein